MQDESPDHSGMSSLSRYMTPQQQQKQEQLRRVAAQKSGSSFVLLGNTESVLEKKKRSYWNWDKNRLEWEQAGLLLWLATAVNKGPEALAFTCISQHISFCCWQSLTLILCLLLLLQLLVTLKCMQSIQQSPVSCQLPYNCWKQPSWACLCLGHQKTAPHHAGEVTWPRPQRRAVVEAGRMSGILRLHLRGCPELSWCYHPSP